MVEAVFAELTETMKAVGDVWRVEKKTHESTMLHLFPLLLLHHHRWRQKVQRLQLAHAAAGQLVWIAVWPAAGPMEPMKDDGALVEPVIGNEHYVMMDVHITNQPMRKHQTHINIVIIVILSTRPSALTLVSSVALGQDGNR